jgi:predicted dehydrogenase
VKPLKAGIIGLGVGEQHIAGYQSHPACQVVALCDFSEEKRTMARGKYPGLRILEHAEELLEDPGIDVVSIASYDNHHFDQIVRAIGHGKHLFVEKPLCLREDEALQIRELLKRNRRLRLSSNLILRVSPRFLAVKSLIADGTLGQPFYVEGDYNYGRLHKITDGWRGEIDFYSVVHGGAIHIVDLLLWLTGDRVAEVCAYANNLASRDSQFRYNDMVVSILKFESGLVGKVSVNYGCVCPHYHALSIYGTKATFINGEPHGTLYESRDHDRPCRSITAEYPGVHKGALIHSFVDSIVNGTEALVTEEDVFRTLSVCMAIETATHHTGGVTVRYM